MEPKESKIIENVILFDRIHELQHFFLDRISIFNDDVIFKSL